MGWQKRIAEMILAGGALAAVGACSTDKSNGVNFCCNANGDPCCAYKNCGGPLTAECACTMDGGVWNSYATYDDASQPVGACEPPGPDSAAVDAARETGPSDARPSD